MVHFLSVFFFLGFLQFLLGFSKVPIFLCHPLFLFLTYVSKQTLFFPSQLIYAATILTEFTWTSTIEPHVTLARHRLSPP